MTFTIGMFLRENQYKHIFIPGCSLFSTSSQANAKNLNSINVKLCNSFLNYSKGKISRQSNHILRQVLDLACVTK